ncbi:MAG: CPXCG motif-containing cysteine-rich protein [Gammaproteobacteria bacterium]|jgi:hypothetical protein
MNGLEEYTVHCPYCGEIFKVLVDCSISQQQYIEDCEICCRPIHFKVLISDSGTITMNVKTEND